MLAIVIAISLLVLLCYYTPVRLAMTLLLLVPALYVAWQYSITENMVFRRAWAQAAFVLIGSALVVFPFYKELDGVAARVVPSDEYMWVVYLVYYLLSIPSLAFLFRQMTLRNDNKPLAAKLGVGEHPVFWWLCLLMGIAAICAQAFCSFSQTLWNDEVFTLCLISHDYAEMTQLGAGDVHPMLYYYITKAVVWLLTLPGIGLDLIAAAKLVSVLPFAIMLVIMATVVRSRIGSWVSAISILGMFALSNMVAQGVEIRMYGWSALWITAACVSLYCVLERPSVLNMCCFVLSGVCAACTHHFAALAYGGLLVAWGIWSLFFAQDIKREMIRYIVCVMAFALLYLPQMLVSLSQFGNVTGHDYWIEPITGLTLLGYLYALFGNSLTGVAIVSVAVVAFAIWRWRMRSRWYRVRMYMAVVAFSLPLWVMVCGVGVSMVLRPVFVFRYLYPTIPCMSLGLAMIAKFSGSTRLCLWYTCIMLSVFAMIMISFVKSERQERADLMEVQRVYEQYPDAAYISENIWTLWELGVDINTRDWYVWRDDLIDNERAIYGIVPERMIDTPVQLMQLSDQYAGGLLFVSNHNPDSLLDQSRYRAVEIGSNKTNTIIYKIERVPAQ